MFIKIEIKSMQMDEVVKGIRALQRKHDFQASMVEAFKGLLSKNDVEENAMLKKSVVIEEAWLATIKNNNKCKQQLVVISCQVGLM
jgi:hypothetical protein